MTVRRQLASLAARSWSIVPRIESVFVAGHRRAPHIGVGDAPPIDAFSERPLD